ncbi:uncharacterized protein LOC141850927 [Brevipalpus obovatus]|uniref:uncharacterized protein LOC141850927 n=1 Tax=Brevipalpus obovatus TaxID=246614 RepID=UPI003D9E1B0F
MLPIWKICSFFSFFLLVDFLSISIATSTKNHLISHDWCDDVLKKSKSVSYEKSNSNLKMVQDAGEDPHQNSGILETSDEKSAIPLRRKIRASLEFPVAGDVYIKEIVNNCRRSVTALNRAISLDNSEMVFTQAQRKIQVGDNIENSVVDKSEVLFYVTLPQDPLRSDGIESESSIPSYRGQIKS